MTPAGYMRKVVTARPDWLGVDGINDIYSLSGCISENFADYINCWKHNGFWLFNAPEAIENVAQLKGVELAGTALFYYEIYEFEFDEESRTWTAFAPDSAFVTDVREPLHKTLCGFDVTTFMARNSPECSPLSCNSLATTIAVNEHCLFRTFEDAKQVLEAGLFENSEPGPFRIFAVYIVA